MINLTHLMFKVFLMLENVRERMSEMKMIKVLVAGAQGKVKKYTHHTFVYMCHTSFVCTHPLRHLDNYSVWH